MLKTDNPIYQSVLLIDLLLALSGIITSIQVLISAVTPLSMRIGTALAVVGLVVSFYYVIRGFSKKQAWAYKTFAVAFILETAMQVYLVANGGTGSLVFMIPVIAYTLALCMLVFVIIGKDLGKKGSVGLSIGVCLMSLISIVYVIITNNGTDDLLSKFYVILSLTQFDMSLMLGVLTYAKYVDKEARGTK